MAPRRTRGDLATVAAGAVGGLALGATARAWMRLISEDPEFTWSGTLFIVGGFTLFGLTQAVGLVARARSERRGVLAGARALGTVGMAPLFVAAGAVMFPTVVGSGLALTRPRWHPVVRALLLLVAAAPVVFVSRGLLDSFGGSGRTALGIAGLVAIYSVVVFAARPTFERRVERAGTARS